MTLENMQLGNYRLIRLVGSGSMGEVYLAEDIRIARQVGIKVVRNEVSAYPNTETTEESSRLFHREMKAIAALDHPNILPLFDFGEQIINNTTYTYMVMAFRPEGSLIDWLQRRNTTALLSPSEVIHIVRLAASALQHAHNRHLVHLDVKPSNFLVRHHEDAPDRLNIVLSDFGIARFSTVTSTASQTIRGTPPYMAPEQWAGHPVAATDQYALAIMAYHLLTGRFPFEGNMQQVMYKHLQERPLPPSAFNPYIPPRVDAVILKALEKKPADRFPSIQEFALAFESAWQPEATRIHLPPPPPPPQTTSPTLATNTMQAGPVQYAPRVPPVPSNKSALVLSATIIGIIVLVIIGGLVFALLNSNSNPSPIAVATPAPTPTPTATPTPVPTIPQLNSTYTGTSDCTRGSCSNHAMELDVNSQDQQGNLQTSGYYDNRSSSFSCTGTVTASRSITLRCTLGSDTPYTFQGKIYSDGHIEGTETFSASNDTYYDILR